MRKQLGCKKGFTLIELIVVIAILGILALIAIPKLTGVQEDARKNSDIANAKSIANVITAANARGKITADAGTLALPVVLPTAATDEIKKAFPDGYPVGKTTVVKDSDFYYYLVQSTGELHIFLKEGTNYREVYPTQAATFK